MVQVRLLSGLLVAVAGFAQPAMQAHFLPVGQAHATLLEFPCGAALIDVGAQDTESSTRLFAYLDQFFARRADLNRTLDLVLITHNHIDHTMGLRELAEKFSVRMYVDNGQLMDDRAGGAKGALWIRANARTGGRDIRVREVAFAEISGLNGLSDDAIDPISCSGVDPQIRVLHGRHDARPSGWTMKQFLSRNNHSLVTRVDFGRASFLFTGDLEEAGIGKLLEHYAGSMNLLDADVYQVGHHGSHNATTRALLTAITPSVAVIPTGNWDFAKGSRGLFHTYAFGHPRRDILELLGEFIPGDREESILIMAATKAQIFAPVVVRKQIYSTAWDGVVSVEAHADGVLKVTRH